MMYRTHGTNTEADTSDFRPDYKALYPTLIILIVALGKSQYESTLSLYRSTHAASVVFQHHGSHNISQLDMDAGPDQSTATRGDISTNSAGTADV